MKKIILIFMLLTTFLLAEEFLGEGKALLGDNITIMEAEDLAFLRAQKDASYKVGTYIESEVITRDFKLVKDEIRTISASVLELKSESKKVEKKLIDGQFYLVVSAVFITDKEELLFQIEEYQKKKAFDRDLSDALSRVAYLEELVKELANDNSESSAKVRETIEELTELYNYIDNSVTFDGSSIVAKYNKEKKAELIKIYNYLLLLKNDILKVVTNNIEILSIEEEKVSNEFRIDLDFYFESRDTEKEVEDEIKELLLREEYNKYVFKDNYLITMVFLGKNDEVLAMAYNLIDRSREDTLAYFVDMEKGIWFRPLVYYSGFDREKLDLAKKYKYRAYISEELLRETKSISILPFKQEILEDRGIYRENIAYEKNPEDITLERYVVPNKNLNLIKEDLYKILLEDFQEKIEELKIEIEKL